MIPEESSDNEELFPVPFPNKDKPTLRGILIYYNAVFQEDQERDKDWKHDVQECVIRIIDCLKNSADNEEVGFPFAGLSIFYHALHTTLNMIDCPAGKDFIKKTLQAAKRDSSHRMVENYKEVYIRVAIHYINYINLHFGQHPNFAEFRTNVEQNWKDIKDGLKSEK